MTRQLSGKHVLIMLAAFFGVILAVNIDLVIKAETSFSGEDQHNAYLQGVDFNKTLADRAEQARLGWHADIQARRISMNMVTITVSLHQADGSPPAAVKLEGRLRHPSNANLDHDLVFKPLGSGRFVAGVAGAAKGLWDIELRSVGSPGRPFEAEKRSWL